MKKLTSIRSTFSFKTLLLIVFIHLNPTCIFSGPNKHTDPSAEYPPFTLTVKNLKIALENAGVQHADIVLRQAILETGWFKCTNCSLSRNNIFGFWYKKKYIQFDDWKDCVAYYKRWQDRHYSGGDYYVFLKKVGYATDPNYVKRLKSIKGI
jgi:hypothetical protein